MFRAVSQFSLGQVGALLPFVEAFRPQGSGRRSAPPTHHGKNDSRWASLSSNMFILGRSHPETKRFPSLGKGVPHPSVEGSPSLGKRGSID